MDFLTPELLLLLPLAFLAGLIDSAVGGGGLIQLPGIFNIIPNHEPPVLHGTNKLSSICGTGMATVQYARRVPLRWRMLFGAVAMALLFAYIGARLIPYLPKEYLRPIMLVLMIAMVIYTFMKKDMGQSHEPRFASRGEMLAGLGLGAAIGFYDGFFGPGTGSLLAFAFVKWFGFDFLTATAHSKVINLATNFAALSFFIPHGYILWGAGLAMGVCNIGGALCGTHVVTKYGAPFIRKILILVLSATIVKFGYDTLISLM
ncbi:UPF0721 transmembrane protein [Formosimonas limnophila]|uniref:Probable membrane transporter protein n=1 Tax=Formosimonas limnophila TaxID=1384487 RepID=A0A8J3CKW1_9BURK|nr:TSUP family transporter [Formosimonas limnophila]GHA73229.1 UPF0721 transmembrane protein [Formosimonas limnophila]